MSQHDNIERTSSVSGGERYDWTRCTNMGHITIYCSYYSSRYHTCGNNMLCEIRIPPGKRERKSLVIQTLHSKKHLGPAYPCLHFIEHSKNCTPCIARDPSITHWLQIRVSRKIIISPYLTADICFFNMPNYRILYKSGIHLSGNMHIMKCGPAMSDWRYPTLWARCHSSNIKVVEIPIPSSDNIHSSDLTPCGAPCHTDATTQTTSTLWRSYKPTIHMAVQIV